MLIALPGVIMASNQRAPIKAEFINSSFDRAVSPKELPHSSNPTQLSPGNQFQLAQRVDVPSNPLLTSDRLCLQIDFVFFPVDPHFNNFTHPGVYHRYRPRDPTT